MKSTVFSLLPGRVLAELESLERSLRMTPRQLDFPQLQQQVEDGDGFEDDVMVYMLYIYIYICMCMYNILFNYYINYYFFHYWYYYCYYCFYYYINMYINGMLVQYYIDMV